ncbi:thiamine diphosphokinase [Jannaschia marina]|uniref:thiamine diphosphokinase n=1 Tax=Jannaschia marina TaxID=2741674 RepID=UPI0015C78314|nr:thiamine diphosphokinase [Jannaschia marina]
MPQTLVGGAPVSTQVLKIALTHGPRVVAVDGGADTLLAAGVMPDLVVGDLDSISGTARDAYADRLHHIAEQDSTDFAKALRTSPAPFSIGVGFIGARVDHFLSVLTELARTRARVLLLGEEDCLCILPPRLSLDLDPGTRVSLWPVGPARGVSTGLEWPIEGLAFGPGTRTGTSNAATGPVTLDVEGTMALILPAAELPSLIAALTSAPRPGGVAPL